MPRAAVLLTLLFAAGCPTELVDDDAGTVAPGDGGPAGDAGAEVDAGDVLDAGCRASPQYGLIVALFDATTDVRICVANVTAFDGTDSETLQLNGGTGPTCRYFGVRDRGGTFDVSVQANGYAPHEETGIPIAVDSCGLPVSAVNLNVELDPIADAGGL